MDGGEQRLGGAADAGDGNQEVKAVHLGRATVAGDVRGPGANLGQRPLELDGGAVQLSQEPVLVHAALAQQAGARIVDGEEGEDDMRRRQLLADRPGDVLRLGQHLSQVAAVDHPWTVLPSVGGTCGGRLSRGAGSLAFPFTPGVPVPQKFCYRTQHCGFRPVFLPRGQRWQSLARRHVFRVARWHSCLPRY